MSEFNQKQYPWDYFHNAEMLFWNARLISKNFNSVFLPCNSVQNYSHVKQFHKSANITAFMVNNDNIYWSTICCIVCRYIMPHIFIITGKRNKYSKSMKVSTLLTFLVTYLTYKVATLQIFPQVKKNQSDFKMNITNILTWCNSI